MGVSQKGFIRSRGGAVPTVPPTAPERASAIARPERVASRPPRGLRIRAPVRRPRRVLVDSESCRRAGRLHTPLVPLPRALLLAVGGLAFRRARPILLAPAPHSPSTRLPLEDDVASGIPPEGRRLGSRPPP